MSGVEKKQNTYRRGGGEGGGEERKERKKEREREQLCRTSARKVGASPFGSYVDPSVLRSPVRASFAMLRSDKASPLGPPVRSPPPRRAPLQIDRTIPHARRSSCTASSSASPRPYRGRKRGDGAREETSWTCLRSTAHDRSSSRLAIAAHLPLPRESDFSFFSPPPPPSPPPSPPPPNLEILSHRPPAATAILAFAVLVAPPSPKDPRVVPSGTTPLPSGRFPPSRFEAACCGRPLSAAEGQRDAPSSLLTRSSLYSIRSHPFRFVFV